MTDKMTIDEASHRLYKHRIKYGGSCCCSQCQHLKSFIEGYESRQGEISLLKSEVEELKKRLHAITTKIRLGFLLEE